MNTRKILISVSMLLALAISAFSPMPIAEASVKLVSKGDVMPGPVYPVSGASALPTEPGIPYRTIIDASELSTASQKRTVSGDNFGKDLFERPFTSQAMVYLPDTDIQTAAISSDPNFFYFTIKLAGVNATDGKLDATYGIELDTNKDGRGDFLVTAVNPGTDWSSTGVMAYSDPNKDVGALTPLRSDPTAKVKSDGYETVLDTSGMVFSRMDPTSSSSIQIAISNQMLSGISQFLWGAYADSGLRDLQGLDYNDHYTVKEAGSPILGDKAYPVKDVSALDNTCRAPFGFSPKTTLPGMCPIPAPVKPAAPRLQITNQFN